MASKTPTYRLVITDKNNNKNKLFAGVAFAGNFDSFNIRLNPGVRLDWRDMDSVWLSLVPYRAREYEQLISLDDVRAMEDSVEERGKAVQAETGADDDKPNNERRPSRDSDFPF